MVPPPNGWQVSQVMAAVASLRGRMMTADANDQDALAEALAAAEANVDHIMMLLLRARDEANAMEEQCLKRADELKSRAVRFANRADEYRRTVYAIMDALGLTAWKHAEYTVSVVAGRPGVVVTDQRSIPEPYWRVTQAPDTAAIKAALQAGEAVPGAMLANGMPTITVRAK